MAKIAIDPGHGVNTPGKRTPKAVPKYGRVVREYEFNKPTAQELKKELERHGHTVVWTGGDGDPSLSSRCKKANDAKADLFISIHYNAGGGHGVETFIVGRGGNAEKLAKKVQPELAKHRKQRDRGVKVANFQVLRDTRMPAILCECGFMDDPRGIEQAWMLDKDFHKSVAVSICKGVQAFYGKAYKPEPSPTPPKPAPKPSDPKPKTTYWRVYEGNTQRGSFAKKENAQALVSELAKKAMDANKASVTLKIEKVVL